jgi:CheY-like chemotaxis protein
MKTLQPLVYVVDDEPLLIELAVALLEPAGYRVQTFLTPVSALQAFSDAEERPAVLVTDYAMHDMTGLDLIRECRQIEPRQKVLMVSGTVDESIYRHSRVKPDLFLPKPYQARQFLQAVESLLKP